MIIKSFLDKVLLTDKRDVLRVHLYLKFLQYNVHPYENDMNIIIELYLFGGYDNPEKQGRFFDICLEKRYKKSRQSVRNTLSKYISLGILDKPKNGILTVNPKFIPTVHFDKLLLQPTISHAD